MSSDESIDKIKPKSSKWKLNKSHIQGLIAGILIMAILMTIGILLFISGVFDKDKGSYLGSLPSLQGSQTITSDNFDEKVLNVSGLSLVFFNDSPYITDGMRDMVSNMSNKWSHEIKVYALSYDDNSYIERLGINIKDLPVIAAFENGKLKSVNRIKTSTRYITVIDENSINEWMANLAVSKVYRAFPSSMFDSLGRYTNQFFMSELLLMPERLSLVGCIKCIDNTILPVSKNQILYALIGNTYGGDIKNFYLPNIQSQIPVPKLNYFICNDYAVFPERDYTVSSVTDGNIKYLEFSIEGLFDYAYIGQIVLAKNIDENKYRDSMMLCDGRTLNIRDYYILESLCGKTFGGDKDTFCIPNMSNVTSPIEGAKYYILLTGLYPSYGN